MAYITNDGARLIERARTEGRLIVFGSVRMNTVYKSDPTSLVQKTEEWYGENHGSVVGCISHVSVNGVSEICDSKLAVQCNDNNESWKSLGIYARLDGEEDEVLLACESIENGEYKDVTIVELPVTLDGVVEDFGLSEGGSGGGEGGGGEVPANMMTTDTEQTGLSGTKTWTWVDYTGKDPENNPQDGDIQTLGTLSIVKDDGFYTPLVLKSQSYTFNGKESNWVAGDEHELKITVKGVRYNSNYASWSSIIDATKVVQGFEHASIHSSGSGIFAIGSEQINPNTTIAIGKYTSIVIDSESHIAGIRTTAEVLDVSASVCEPNGNNYSVSGIASHTAGLSFDHPITPAEGQNIFIRWVRPPKQGK